MTKIERARFAVYEETLETLIKEARAKCQPYANREGHLLDWWRGHFQALVAAKALLAPVLYPSFNPEEEAAARLKLK